MNQDSEIAATTVRFTATRVDARSRCQHPAHSRCPWPDAPRTGCWQRRWEQRI